jgi:hypothetical protein
MTLLITGVALVALACLAALFEVLTAGHSLPIVRPAVRFVLGALVAAFVLSFAFVRSMQVSGVTAAAYYAQEATVVVLMLFWISFAVTTAVSTLSAALVWRRIPPRHNRAGVQYAYGSLLAIVAAAEVAAIAVMPRDARDSALLYIPLVFISIFVGWGIARVSASRGGV